MPCDGKNKSCQQRRELLHQLKCLIGTMERKKPCEWDERLCPSLELPKFKSVACATSCPVRFYKSVCKSSCSSPCESMMRITVDPLYTSPSKPISQRSSTKKTALPLCKPIFSPLYSLMCIKTSPTSCKSACPPNPIPLYLRSHPTSYPPYYVMSRVVSPMPCPTTCPPSYSIIRSVPYKPACFLPGKPTLPTTRKTKHSTLKSCYSICAPLKSCKSFELRSSFLHKCQCIRRDGLQDKCLMSDCMGYPECITKLFPICVPGQSALMKLCYMARS